MIFRTDSIKIEFNAKIYIDTEKINDPAKINLEAITILLLMLKYVNKKTNKIE